MNEIASLIFYLSIFLCTSLLIAINSHNKKNKFSIIVIFALSMPILIATFRYSVGTDYFSYMRAFEQSRYITFKEYISTEGIFEIGNFLIRKLTISLNSYSLLLFIYACITIIPIYMAMWEHRYKINIGLSMFIFLCIYFPSSLNLMTQFAAVSLVALAFKYIFKKNFLKFITVILLASFFHTSSLFVAPIYFLWDKKSDDLVSRWKIFIVIALCIVFAFNYQMVISSLSQMNIFEEYSSYAELNNEGQNRDIFIKLLLFISIFLVRKPLIQYDNRNKLYILLIFFNLIVGITGYTSPWVKRITFYFEITQIFILPSILRLFISKWDRAFITLGICVYTFLYFILVYYILGNSNVIPYRLIE